MSVQLLANRVTSVVCRDWLISLSLSLSLSLCLSRSMRIRLDLCRLAAVVLNASMLQCCAIKRKGKPGGIGHVFIQKLNRGLQAAPQRTKALPPSLYVSVVCLLVS